MTFGSGTVAGLELAAQLNPMRMVVQHPRLLDPTPGDTTWRDHDFGGVDVLIQKATRDTIAVDVDNVTDDLTRGGAHVTVREYLGYHVLATPAVQRHRDARCRCHRGVIPRLGAIKESSWRQQQPGNIGHMTKNGTSRRVVQVGWLASREPTPHQ